MFKYLLSILTLYAVLVGCAPEPNKEVVIKVDYSPVLKRMARPHNLKFQEVLEATLDQNPNEHLVTAFFKTAKRIYPSVNFRDYFKWEHGIKAGVSDKRVIAIVRGRCDKDLSKMKGNIRRNLLGKMTVLDIEDLDHSKLKISMQTELSDDQLRSVFQGHADIGFYTTKQIVELPALLEHMSASFAAKREADSLAMVEDTSFIDEDITLDDLDVEDDIPITTSFASIWAELRYDPEDNTPMHARKEIIDELLDSLNRPELTDNGKIRFIRAKEIEELPDIVYIHACVVNPDKNVLLTSASIKSAESQFDESYGEQMILITFNKAGTEKFAQLSTEETGNIMAIVLNDEVIYAPRINEPVRGGKVQISGGFSIEEANRLASFLGRRNVSLPCKVLSIKAI